VLLTAGVLVQGAPALARSRGIVPGTCEGCHGGSGLAAPELSLTADHDPFNPGDSLTLTLTIRSPSVRAGGTYITTGGVGQLQAISGEGLTLNSQGLTHTAAKAAAGGAVTFRFGWKAPSQPGGVNFQIAALAANGNGNTSGDAPGTGQFQWVFGCTARTFFGDSDRDGYGTKSFGTLLGCSDAAAPEGYASMDGDCDENDEKVHPGAVEVCNKKDDNCDGQIDENAPPVMMWPDSDGDGYYKSQQGTAKMGCGAVPGYAANAGDCDDGDRTVHPGATEVCNNKDDDCDGDVDERVRPQCGLGWCSRYSPTCDAKDCSPGTPAKEVCNSFDDDCDGENDNDACPAGMICSGSSCVASSGESTSGGSTQVPPPPGAGSGSTSVGNAGAPSGAEKSGASGEPGCAVASAGGTAGAFYAAFAIAGWLGRGMRRRRKRC